MNGLGQSFWDDGEQTLADEPSVYTGEAERPTESGLMRDALLALAEWRELAPVAPARFVLNLARLIDTDSNSFNFLLDLAGNGFDAWKSSFEERAEEAGVTKQAVFKAEALMAAKLKDDFPELASLILRHGKRE